MDQGMHTKNAQLGNRLPGPAAGERTGAYYYYYYYSTPKAVS